MDNYAAHITIDVIDLATKKSSNPIVFASTLYTCLAAFRRGNIKVCSNF